MAYRIGVDIGGTFTDFAIIDDISGKVAIHKQLTTPQEPSVSVLEGCRTLLAAEGIAIDQVEAIVHGTTLVTNAVIERKGAVIGALVTQGFKDVFDIASERRYDIFDLKLQFPEALVPRAWRAEIRERVRFDGSVEHKLDVEAVRREVRRLVKAAKIEAIAICFLNSFRNPAHEEQAAEIISKEFPSLYVSSSAEVFPYIREFERWTTTTVNAYTQPMVDRYLKKLDGSLKELGFLGRLYIMSSNGGTIVPDLARRFPVRMLESGPAAGALMSAYLGRQLDIANVLSFDMGGTTAKGCLVCDKQPLKKYSLEVARIHKFKAGSGLPVRIPVIDMIEIGSGGGSIAELDARGMIRVGPSSAGADPGPACYGRGGQSPTLTDADLVLGYLDPSFFLGGKMKLEKPKAETAISSIGSSLKLDAARAAWGIYEVVNEDVARAFRIHATEQGFDYRSCTMIAFGGAGPLHALRIARKLKIPRVVFPVGAGVMSAFGLLASPLSFEIVKSDIVRVDKLDADIFAAQFDKLIDQTTIHLKQAGVKDAEIHVMHRLDVRYYGQGYELEVTLPDKNPQDVFAALPKLFAEVYERVFGMSYLEQPLEIVNWKIEARGPIPHLRNYQHSNRRVGEAQSLKGHRPAYFENFADYQECPVYDRYALRPGDQIKGPAFIEENESTCVIGDGDLVIVDDRLNLVAELATVEADQ
jgi:N-methylhydantoinase A